MLKPFSVPTMYHYLTLASYFYLLTVSVGSAAATTTSAGREREVLLELKASVSDPTGFLSGWIVSSDHCSWQWISCDAEGRVVSVNISAYPSDITPSCSRSRPFQWCYSDPGRSLAGRLSPAIGMLTELRIISLPFHSFYGEIPREIWGLKNLEVIDLEGNSLVGTLPSRFPHSLRVLKLASNLITGEIPISLSRCIHLEILDLSRNRLNGSLPRFLSSFSKLTQLHLSFNVLEKSIPEEIGSGCISLEYLDLSGNSLAGSIPSSLGNCSHLQYLFLFSNRLDGVIPSDLGRLEKLRALDVSKNCLSGYIPEELGNCKELAVLVLTNMFDPMPAQNSLIYHEKHESNNFHGGISWKITSLPKLRILWAPRGNFEGEFPRHWGICESLEIVSLRQNRFTGKIPRDFNKCVNMKFLDLSLNKLTGRLCEELPVPCLDFFDVSGNRLSGSIPSFIHEKCPLSPSITNDLLTAYSLFFTSRTIAEIDNYSSISVSHLQNSSGESPGKSGGGLSSFWITAIASAAAIVSVLMALLALYIYSRKCMPSSSVQSSEIRGVTIFADVGLPLTYETVVRATGNFNASNCIGSGGFGATYKAEISPGVLVAIKRLSVGRFQGAQQFHAEIKTLGRWRHSNLVTLIGYYGSNDEMFLIYNYLPGGNLEKFLQERSRRQVDWKMLHKIALDVARALTYLHEQCVPRILHRDVKPSNILLDNDFNAYLSDFGLARLLGNSETHATTGVAGTFGYVAPEYAMTCRVSDKADVYSYGVVLLELLSDKKALDPSFSPYGDGFNIVTWAAMLLQQTRAHEFFTEGLWPVAPHQQLIEALKLALRCTEEQLSQRPSMRQVVRALKELQPSSF